jgi:metallo-beta-lactamase class B
VSKKLLLVLLAVSALTAHLAAQGREVEPSASSFAESREAQKHVAAAMALAKTDLAAEAKTFCTPTGPQRPANARRAAGLPALPNRLLEPIRFFDNLYYVGFSEVGAWALSTSAGIILFDSLNNEKEAREVLVPGLRKVGLDPAQIKYVVMSHGHNDHTGGGAYLQSTYGARVLMGAPDWKDGPMKREVEVKDVQTLTLGDTTVTLALTPGHTPGSIAALVPVKHRGRSHSVILFGGTPSATTESVAAFERFFDTVARKQNAESAFNSHPGILVNTIDNMQALAKQYPSGTHPLLYGAERFGRYMSIMVGCTKARVAAAQGQS